MPALACPPVYVPLMAAGTRTYRVTKVATGELVGTFTVEGDKVTAHAHGLDGFVADVESSGLDDAMWQWACRHHIDLVRRP